MYVPRIRKGEQVVKCFVGRDKNSVMTKAMISNLAKERLISEIRVGRNVFYNLDEIITVLSSGHKLSGSQKASKNMMGCDAADTGSEVILGENVSMLNLPSQGDCSLMDKRGSLNDYVSGYREESLLPYGENKRNNFHEKKVGRISEFTFLTNSSHSKADVSDIMAIKRRPMHPHELISFLKEHDADCPLNKCTFITMAKLKRVFYVMTACGHYLIDLNEVLQYFSGKVNQSSSKSVPRLRNYEKCYFSVRKWRGNNVSWSKFNKLIEGGSTFSYWNINRWGVNYDLVKGHFGELYA